MNRSSDCAPDDDNLFSSLLAGFVGGLAGSWTMSHVQRWWTHAAGDQPPSSRGGRHDARDWQERTEGQNANELLPQRVARATLGRSLSDTEMAVAAPLSHYLFGGVMGALYGAVVRRRGDTSLVTGAMFGALLWVAADEIAVPLLGLSEPPPRRPAEMHAQALAAHLVYGMTAEAARKGAGAILAG